MRFHTFLTLLSLALLFSACLGSSSTVDCNLTDVLCSCDKLSATTSPNCTDYDGGGRDSTESDCIDEAGTFSKTAGCPTESRVGTCKTQVGNLSSYIRYYQDPVTSEAACRTVELTLGFTGAVTWTAN